MQTQLKVIFEIWNEAPQHVLLSYFFIEDKGKGSHCIASVDMLVLPPTLRYVRKECKETLLLACASEKRLGAFGTDVSDFFGLT
jgi:hypothetical protein